MIEYLVKEYLANITNYIIEYDSGLLISTGQYEILIKWGIHESLTRKSIYLKWLKIRKYYMQINHKQKSITYYNIIMCTYACTKCTYSP